MKNITFPIRPTLNQINYIYKRGREPIKGKEQSTHQRPWNNQPDKEPKYATRKRQVNANDARDAVSRDRIAPYVGI